MKWILALCASSILTSGVYASEVGHALGALDDIFNAITFFLFTLAIFAVYHFVVYLLTPSKKVNSAVTFSVLNLIVSFILTVFISKVGEDDLLYLGVIPLLISIGFLIVITLVNRKRG